MSANTHADGDANVAAIKPNRGTKQNPKNERAIISKIPDITARLLNPIP